MRCIDADALRDRLQNLGYDDWNQGATTTWAEAFSECADMVDEQPTIDPERKKGKWIEQDDSWDGVYYECSACGEPWTTIDGTPWDNGMNFCPKCGAEMREDEG